MYTPSPQDPSNTHPGPSSRTSLCLSVVHAQGARLQPASPSQLCLAAMCPLMRSPGPLALSRAICSSPSTSQSISWAVRLGSTSAKPSSWGQSRIWWAQQEARAGGSKSETLTHLCRGVGLELSQYLPLVENLEPQGNLGCSYNGRTCGLCTSERQVFSPASSHARPHPAYLHFWIPAAHGRAARNARSPLCH